MKKFGVWQILMTVLTLSSFLVTLQLSGSKVAAVLVTVIVLILLAFKVGNRAAAIVSWGIADLIVLATACLLWAQTIGVTITAITHEAVYLTLAVVAIAAVLASIIAGEYMLKKAKAVTMAMAQIMIILPVMFYVVL